MAQTTQKGAAIPISQFIAAWTEVLDQTEHQKTEHVMFDEYLKTRMDIDDAMVAELDAVCGLDTLKCDGEPEDRNVEVRHKCLKEIPKNLPLLTTEFQQRELKKREQHSWRRTNNAYKYREAPILHMLKQTDESYTTNVVPPEAIISIRVYHPARTYIKISQEFQVLGSQKLTELRDKIACVADTVVVGEFSEKPNLPQDIIAGDLYKSGFFFIENTFYNDARDDNCRDYSAIIRKWAQDEKRRFGPYQTSIMENVRFSDLTVRLGYPYLYMHQGDCEHLVFFSNIRMLHREDCWDSRYYPMVVGKLNARRLYCKACQVNVSTWVVRNSLNAPEDPCFFCDTCFKSFHYNSDGQKLGTFEAYPYPNGGAII